MKDNCLLPGTLQFHDAHFFTRCVSFKYSIECLVFAQRLTTQCESDSANTRLALHSPIGLLHTVTVASNP